MEFVSGTEMVPATEDVEAASLGWQRARHSRGVSSDKGEGRLRHLNDVCRHARALGEDFHVDSDRRPSLADDICIEAQQVADKNGLPERERIDGDGDDASVRAPAGGNRSGNTDM